VWSTIVVIFGVALVWAGNTWNVPWLVYADSLAALAVAGVILWLSSQLGRRTIDALLDAAPEGLQNEITNAIAHMEGVLGVERVRVRRSGNRHFVDATVSVPRAANLEQVHALTDAIEQRVGQIVPADVLVHTEPRAPDNEDLFESIRAVAQRMGHPIHDISAYQQDGNLFVELHLEVDENLSLGEAHRQATDLEEAIAALGGGDHKLDVNIHIEPLGRHISTPEIGVGEMRQLELAVEAFLNHMPRNYDELLNCHDVRVRQVEHHILVSCHCVMKSEYSITRIHDVLAALEDLVKERFPQISRVTIHPEPPDAF
jgi:divalent metal cation (Fe/Co/Zn/Cd) transporter